MNDAKYRELIEAFETIAASYYEKGYDHGKAKQPKLDPKYFKLNAFARQKLRLLLFSK